MSTVPVMQAENIVKELGSGAGLVVAVKGVSLELVPGELTLLMGPSGSGKTTLLSILGCIMKPTAGSIRIADTVVDGLSAEGVGEGPPRAHRLHFPVLQPVSDPQRHRERPHCARRQGHQGFCCYEPVGRGFA